MFRVRAIPDRDGERSLDIKPGDTLTVRFLYPPKPKSRVKRQKRRLRVLYANGSDDGDDEDTGDPPEWARPLLDDDFDPRFVAENAERTLSLHVQEVFWGTRHLIDVLDRGAAARRRDTQPQLQTTGYVVCDALV